MQFNLLWTAPRAFHKKNKCSQPIELEDAVAEPVTSQMIEKLGEMAANLEAEGNMDNPLTLRLQLELEELAEKFAAIEANDPVAVIDGTCDQLYVNGGTLETFNCNGQPLSTVIEESFIAVHQANMKKLNRDGQNRVRDKGEDLGVARCRDQESLNRPEDGYR